jgi:ribosome-binding factor A
MTSKKSQRRPAPPLRSEFHDVTNYGDDGVDPREFFRQGKPHRRGADRKTLQLCSQVRDALNYLLGGDSADELLALFQVAEVRPAPDASQLLVVVFPAVQLAAPIDAGEILGRLLTASGRLRAGVAAAITRKRAPKLLFQVIAMPTGAGEGA